MLQNPAVFFGPGGLTSRRQISNCEKDCRPVRPAAEKFYGSDMLKNAFSLSSYHYSSYYLSEWFNE